MVKAGKSFLSRNCKNLTIFCIVLIMVIGVPALLNWILKTETPLKSVIGGENAPEKWLVFWGSYLAAIGSILTAVIAHINNKNNLGQTRLEIQIKRQEAKQQYIKNQVECYENLYSILQIEGLVETYKHDKWQAQVETNKVLKTIKSTPFEAQDYSNTEEYKQYGELLSVMNKNYFEIVTEINDIIAKGSKDDKETTKKLDQIITKIEENEWLKSITNAFQKAGFDLLLKVRNDLEKMYEQLSEIA